MIPKVIHFCWFGGKPLSKDILKCIDSWKKFCPDYEIKRWDESNYNVKSNAFVRKAYETEKWAFVSDYARLEIIYNEGGIYLDTDVELLQSLDDIRKNECYFGVQQDRKLIATGLGFGASKGHPAIKLMLKEYEKVVFDKDRLLDLSCPVFNTRALERVGYITNGLTQTIMGARIYEACYFDPLAPGKTENLMCDKTISIHHYSATWTSKSNQIKRAVFRMIGEDKIHAVKKILHR